MRLVDYCLNISMETILMNTENNKINEPHKFVRNLPQRVDLQNSNQYVALQNLFICYTWKNKTQMYEKNKLKIIAPAWNDEFEWSDGSSPVAVI